MFCRICKRLFVAFSVIYGLFFFVGAKASVEDFLEYRGSVMFYDSELKNIYSGNYSRLNESSVMDVTDIGKISEFYVSSLYSYNDEWVVWMNGKLLKNNQDNKLMSGIKVDIVKDDFAFITYSLNSFDQIGVDYQKYFNKIADSDGDWAYISSDGKVKVSEDETMVSFKISSNQTFSLYNLKIFEGKHASQANLGINGESLKALGGSSSAVNKSEQYSIEDYSRGKIYKRDGSSNIQDILKSF